MSATDHTKHYSAADIQRYLAGDLSPADMHALEMAALDDPFLADAIEGMQQSLAQAGSPAIDTNLQALHKQLQERVAGNDRRQQAPVIAFRWWQAAVAAAVIVVGGIWIFNGSPDHEAKAPQQVAKVEAQENSKPEELPPAMAADSSVVASKVATAPEHEPAMPAKAEKAGSGKSAQDANTTKDKAGLAKNQLADDNANLQRVYKAQPAPVSVNSEAKAFNQLDEVVVAKTHQPAATRNNLSYQPVTDSNRAALVLKKNLANRNQDHLSNTIVSSNLNRNTEFEQIVVSKTPLDTSAAGYLSKPRERSMNLSRKELSARQAKKNPDALLSGFVSGRVTDNATNSPISNAMVRIDGNRDYFTDNKGFFKIPITDSVVNVAVGTSGYYTQNLRLNYNTNNFISLNQLGDKAPNPILNGLQGRAAGLVIDQRTAADSLLTIGNKQALDNYNANYSYSAARDTVVLSEAFKAAAYKSKPNLLAQNAAPEYGWVKYQQYLDQHKQLPANGTAGAGKVVVTFEVDKKGALSDFVVVSSPGQAYADEAIRLIKAGPSWKLLKGRKAKTTVIVTF